MERKPSCSKRFCYWSLSIISTDNYIILLFLGVFLSTLKFDLVCKSDSYLDPDTSDFHIYLEIVGHTSIRAYHQFNIKPSDVFIYYKLYLTFRLLEINFEISFTQ